MKKSTNGTTRTIEVTVSLSAKIPTGQFENYAPFFCAKEIITTEEQGDAIISSRTDDLRAILAKKLEDEYERVRTENIKRTRQDIRFYPRNGKQYPSVTSIISAIEPIDFDPAKLRQYASRGSLVHAQVDHFFKTGIWEKDILKIPGTKLDYLCVTQGDLKLNWTDCSFPNFWDKHSKDFVVESTETKLFNDTQIYAGTADIVCTYQGKRTIADIKTASTYENGKVERYWKQLAAYAKCLEGIEQMVIIPLNPSNKSGFGAPLIEQDVNRFWGLFLQDRAAFRELYGI